MWRPHHSDSEAIRKTRQVYHFELDASQGAEIRPGVFRVTHTMPLRRLYSWRHADVYDGTIIDACVESATILTTSCWGEPHRFFRAGFD